MNDSYTRTQVNIADLCKAIAHPARVAIVQYLLTQSACVCGDIVDELPLSQSTVSQHLKALKKVGLIQGTVSGPKVCYCINPVVWDEFSSMITPIFNEVETKLNCCQ
ncbi:metalloregulator ArsR/SmtB family transcription factor [Flavobacteriales bacterium]|nr:metalloregulator ArsR/SmtB family transcription factor [Flavobacteriales bacterium]MDC3337873.1 metalloregulator ArsR/SmtB family transcription factor [Flavobacteriales bacterium]MDG2330991.1 metalloregulator ArsR/SmtB family transcription factor [Flavobacteriales bacterium]